MKEILAILRPQQVQITQDVLFEHGIETIMVSDVLGRGREGGMMREADRVEGAVARVSFIKKRLLSFVCPDKKVNECLHAIVKVNQTGRVGDGKIFVCPVSEVKR